MSSYQDNMIHKQIQHKIERLNKVGLGFSPPWKIKEEIEVLFQVVGSWVAASRSMGCQE